MCNFIFSAKGMNLRSGAVTQDFWAKNKMKKMQMTNKSKQDMEGSSLEETPKKMLMDFKEDNK